MTIIYILDRVEAGVGYDYQWCIYAGYTLVSKARCNESSWMVPQFGVWE